MDCGPNDAGLVWHGVPRQDTNMPTSHSGIEHRYSPYSTLTPCMYTCNETCSCLVSCQVLRVEGQVPTVTYDLSRALRSSRLSSNLETCRGSSDQKLGVVDMQRKPLSASDWSARFFSACRYATKPLPPPSPSSQSRQEQGFRCTSIISLPKRLPRCRFGGEFDYKLRVLPPHPAEENNEYRILNLF